MKQKKLTILAAIILVPIFSFQLYTVQLRSQIPNFELRDIEGRAHVGDVQEERILPFFEVMTPIPVTKDVTIVPQLDYRKGPPKRYLSRLSYWLIPNDGSEKEVIEYIGRRSFHNSSLKWLVKLHPNQKLEYAHFLALGLDFAATNQWPKKLTKSPLYLRPLVKTLLLKVAAEFVDSKNPYIFKTDQSGVPAFLFTQSQKTDNNRYARMIFFRRNSQFEVRMRSAKAFKLLKPIENFQRSFLVRKRADALKYISSELASVHLEASKLQDLQLSDLKIPLLLLGSKISLDPSGIHGFFHFAGLNSLLFNHFQEDEANIELRDRARNNVLVSNQYGKDIAPNSRQSAEIARLARKLLSIFKSN